MQAEIKSIHSPDINDLEKHQATGSFCFLVQLLMGPKGQEGEESFDIEVLSPAYLEETLQDNIISGRHIIIIKEFSYKKLEEYLQKTLLRFKADNWNDLALKIGRYGHWEFEDYKE